MTTQLKQLSQLLSAQTELGSFTPPSNKFGPGSNTNDGALSNLESMISSIIGFITVIGGVAFIIYFLLGSLEILLAGGDSNKVSGGAKKLLQSTIGLVLLVSAYAIVGFIGRLLGFDLLNPAEIIRTQLSPGATP